KAYVPPKGDKAKTKPDSPYAVEILAGPSGDACEPRPATKKDNQLFVDVKDGEVYRIKLYNNSEYEAAVSITIDGVDAFQFYEPADKKPKAFLVGAGKSRVINGWKRNTAKSNEFYVGKYEESAAYKTLKSSANVGTITICYHHCWEKDKTPP